MFRTLGTKIRAIWRKWHATSSGRHICIDFYTREGCCLCDDALKILASARSRYPFELNLIDVDQAVPLQHAYGTRVPVITVNGRERFHGRVNRVLLERLLAAESAQG